MSSTAPAVRAPPAPKPASPAAHARAWLRGEREKLERRYFRRPDPVRNLADHAAIVDEVLGRLWREAQVDPAFALVAVGGYGRGALFPHSDVDVLVLLPDGRVPDASVERFISMLWDCGLEPGHSVRTIAECAEEAAKDVTVDTSVLESRHVAGDAGLLSLLDARLRERRNVRAFFDAKFQEQKRRHERFQEAAYNL